MAENDLAYLHKQHSEGENKYTYFLLAVTASAVAFCVQKTDDVVITWSLIPMVLAVIAWISSFYCGCKNLIWVQSTTFANYNLLQLQKGTHENQPPKGVLLEVAIKGTYNALTSNISKAAFYAIWQFRLLITGAVFFLLWHLIGIVIRTYKPVQCIKWSAICSAYASWPSPSAVLSIAKAIIIQ